MGSSTDPLIQLQNGPAIPESVVVWLLSAEDRGLNFSIRPDGRLFVGPKSRITADDDRFVGENRDLLLACLVYIDRLEKEPV